MWIRCMHVGKPLSFIQQVFVLDLHSKGICAIVKNSIWIWIFHWLKYCHMTRQYFALLITGYRYAIALNIFRYLVLFIIDNLPIFKWKILLLVFGSVWEIYNCLSFFGVFILLCNYLQLHNTVFHNWLPNSQLFTN